MQSDAPMIAEQPPIRIPFFRSMRGMLLAWFVLLAIVPMVAVIAVFPGPGRSGNGPARS